MFKSVHSRNQSLSDQENRMEEYLEQCFKRIIISPPFLPKGHLVMSGNIFACDKYTGSYCIYWLGVKEAAMHPTMYRTTPRTKRII